MPCCVIKINKKHQAKKQYVEQSDVSCETKLNVKI